MSWTKWLLLGMLMLSGPLWAAEKRVALVIGNSAYPARALENPRNDATAIAASLKRLGFTVELKLDAGKAEMDAAMRRFGNQAEGAEVAALFYAGHGLQVNGYNYLVPVDAKSQNERDLKRDMVRLDDIIDDMNQAKVKLVFFDACRDNPLARSFTRGASRGLAAPAEASGTLISFATKHGNTAADGEGKHSPYTQALLAELSNPQVEIEKLLKNVNQNVKKSTRGQQEPWKYGSLDGDFYFIQVPVNVTVNGGATDPLAVELAFWNSVKDSGKAEELKLYLERYPQGQFAALARGRAKSLEAVATPPAASVAPVAVSPAPSFSAGQIIKDCAECPEMVAIATGTFERGDSNQYSDAYPIHTVSISQIFAIGKTEVTQGQWKVLMGNNPSHFIKCGDDCPVENVNWNDAQEFIRRLNNKTNKIYRLPSEAEWEYACRAGEKHKYCGGDNIYAMAWSGAYDDMVKNASPTTVSVAQKQPNAWGLYDMSGNVHEWTQDCWNDKYLGAPRDGSAWISGECGRRVRRGGSWNNYPGAAFPGSRNWNSENERIHTLGFRLARMLP